MLCNFRPPKLPKCFLLSKSLSRFSLALCKLTWEVSGRCYKLSQLDRGLTPPPPPQDHFSDFSYRIKHQHLMFLVSIRSSLECIFSQVQWWSVSMVTRYDGLGSRWSSRFWVKVHVFQLFWTIELNPVAKIMQSAYLCIIFHVKHKKITMCPGFNLISNSWQNPRWWPLLVTWQASSSVTTHKNTSSC